MAISIRDPLRQLHTAALKRSPERHRHRLHGQSLRAGCSALEQDLSQSQGSSASREGHESPLLAKFRLILPGSATTHSRPLHRQPWRAHIPLATVDTLSPSQQDGRHQ